MSLESNKLVVVACSYAVIEQKLLGEAPTNEAENCEIGTLDTASLRVGVVRRCHRVLLVRKQHGVCPSYAARDHKDPFGNETKTGPP
jgi:hypothetical protein